MLSTSVSLANLSSSLSDTVYRLFLLLRLGTHQERMKGTTLFPAHFGTHLSDNEHISSISQSLANSSSSQLDTDYKQLLLLRSDIFPEHIPGTQSFQEPIVQIRLDM